MGIEGQEWIKLSVRFLDDPDIEPLTNTQKMFYVGLICYSAEHLTDGYCSRALTRLVSARLRVTFETRRRALTSLEGARLLEPEGEGWRIRNYFKWQLPREKILANKQANRQRMAETRATRHLPAEPADTQSGRVVQTHSRRQEVRSKKEEEVSPSSAVELSRVAHPQGGEEDEDKSKGQPTVVGLALDRLAAFDLARAIDGGMQIIDQVAYREACRQRRVEANRDEIADLAVRYPKWPVEQIVSIIADGPLARPRVPEHRAEEPFNGHRPDFKKLREQAGLLKRVDDELGGNQ